MAEAATKRPRGWKSRLLRTPTPRRAIKPILANAMIALREAPAWFGAFAYNEFSREATLMAAPPWEMIPADWMPRPVTPHDDLLITEWLQKEGITVDVGVAAQAVEAVAKDRLFHPVREYLEHLEWDGIPRIRTWLHDYLGTDDNLYTQIVGRCMLVAAVARIYDPGCKVDNVPIIEGGQGIGKSSALRTLFDPWFTDEIADLGSKDAAMQAAGVWGVEMAELDAMSHPEAARAKAFISRTKDRFRPPYGRRVVEVPRSSVLWGTTNSDTYLKDETGGRRFWPIRARKIKLDGLRRNRDQLWAEALEYYLAGTPWWIDNPEVYRAATEEQAERYVGDPWDNIIQGLTELNDELSIAQVLTAVGVETGRQNQSEMNRVARCLKALGWTRVQAGTGRDRRWIYRKGRKEG
jgi:predicted P-loop ATPase